MYCLRAKVAVWENIIDSRHGSFTVAKFLHFFFLFCFFSSSFMSMSFRPSQTIHIFGRVSTVLTSSAFDSLHVSLPDSPPRQSCFIYLSSLKLYILDQRYNTSIPALVAKAPHLFSLFIHHFSPHHSRSCCVCLSASMSVC